ncbi:MAG: hypothetical protein KGQ87_10275, partial [Verrucomicrobia bacterium]|nr:hypothetical protein [Verrucomicrobiota bacterium]
MNHETHEISRKVWDFMSCLFHHFGKAINPNSEVEMQTKRALTTDYTDCTDKEKSQKMRSSIISKSAKSVVK